MNVYLGVQGCEAGQGRTPSLENLQQENDALRDQLARMSTQLLEVKHHTVHVTDIIGYSRPFFICDI